MIQQRVGKQPFGAVFFVPFRSSGLPSRFAPEMNFVSKTGWDPVVWYGSVLPYHLYFRSMNHGGEFIKNNQKMIFSLKSFANHQKMIIFASSLRQKAMFDLMKGLKAREEMLESLRFLFRHEEQLKKEGWYSDSEFFEVVIQTFLEGIEKMLKE